MKKSAGDELTGEVECVGSKNLMAREPPWKENELPPVVSIMYIASANLRERGEHLPSQLL